MMKQPHDGRRVVVVAAAAEMHRPLKLPRAK